MFRHPKTDQLTLRFTGQLNAPAGDHLLPVDLTVDSSLRPENVTNLIEQLRSYEGPEHQQSPSQLRRSNSDEAEAK